jgi:hypothetical protein
VTQAAAVEAGRVAAVVEPASDGQGAVHGLFNHPGLSFWISGTGEEDRVRIRIRWQEFATASLAERFECAPKPAAIRAAIVLHLRSLFDEVRELGV